MDPVVWDQIYSSLELEIKQIQLIKKRLGASSFIYRKKLKNRLKYAYGKKQQGPIEGNSQGFSASFPHSTKKPFEKWGGQ
jgi:hypothetical protein